MSKATTLIRVKQEITEGRLGIARDRLRGLITAYPDDLSLRTHVAEVYWKLGYPVLAGQFWFLDSELGEEEGQAVQAFLLACNNDPKTVLHRLRLRGGPEGLDGKARERVEEQVRAYRAKFSEEPTFPAKPLEARLIGSRVWIWGCTLLALLMLATMMIGLVEIVRWIF